MPTSGTAFVQGLDIRTEMDEIYTSMGVCPQHEYVLISAHQAPILPGIIILLIIKPLFRLVGVGYLFFSLLMNRKVHGGQKPIARTVGSC